MLWFTFIYELFPRMEVTFCMRAIWRAHYVVRALILYIYIFIRPLAIVFPSETVANPTNRYAKSIGSADVFNCSDFGHSRSILLICS